MNDMRKFDCTVYGPSKLVGRKRELGTPLYQNVVHAKSAAEATAMIEASAIKEVALQRLREYVIQIIE